MSKQSEVIGCKSVNSCEKCGVLHVAHHDDIVIDASNCTKFYQNYFFLTQIKSPFGNKQGGKRCCEGTLRIVSNVSELRREEIKNESFVSTTDLSTTEQVSQISQQMVAGTKHLPDYLLFGLGGISGLLFFTTIVTIVVFSVRRRKEQKTKSILKNRKESNRKMVEYQRRISTFRRVDFIKTNATQTNSISSDDAISPMTQGEDLYENTTEGYLDTNDLRPTTCLKESNSKMVKYPNSTFRRVHLIENNAIQTNSISSDESTYVNISMTQDEDLYVNTFEGYLDTNDLRPTTCIRSNKDKPGSTLADYIELC